MTFKQLLDLSGMSIKQVCIKYSIPISTATCWANGSRRPPEYVILMMFDILLLEGVISSDQETGLECESQGRDSSLS